MFPLAASLGFLAVNHCHGTVEVLHEIGDRISDTFH
jgi:hypothetical protein